MRDKAAFEIESSAEGVSRTFTVTLSKRPDARPPSYHGELHLRAPGRSPSIREVTGVDCTEVAEAIAVVIAIELGPEQRDPMPVATTSAEKTKSAPTPPAGWRWAASAAGGFTEALSDTLSAEGRLSLALRRNASALFSPEFRVALVYADGRRVENEGGSIELRLFGLAFEGCPMRARLWHRISLEPCGKAMFAMRAASGGPPSNAGAESNTGAWVDIGALLRMLYDISDSAWIELSAEGFAPMVRDRFYTFTPNIAVFAVPRAGARGAFGLGIYF